MDDLQIIADLAQVSGGVWLAIAFFMVTTLTRLYATFRSYKDGHRTRLELIEETRKARELNAQVVDRLLSMVEKHHEPRVIPIFKKEKKEGAHE